MPRPLPLRQSNFGFGLDVRSADHWGYRSLPTWRRTMSHSCPLLTVTALLVLLGFAPCRAHAAQDVKEPAQTQEEKFDSPRIAALWKEFKTGNHAALESFWQE